jgi:hypothetical protein
MNETLPSSEHPTASSRYERVKSILDAAAGQSTADYQGYGRFWHLRLDEFLQVSIYGQRMVAPAPPAAPGSTATAKNPCHCPSDPAGQIGRGAASGLVRGLRGEFPFDGEQFPPLPWGGMPVTEPDISFIERWIDDGCPATDASEHVAGAATVAQRRALARGDAPNVRTCHHGNPAFVGRLFAGGTQTAMPPVGRRILHRMPVSASTTDSYKLTDHASQEVVSDGRLP